MAELIREKGSRDLVANFGYANGEEVVNHFDSKYPWNGIEEIVDDYGDSWVRIPKFYRVINVENGVVKGRELSEYKVGDDWLLNHNFVNNAGTSLNYVEIAKYQMSLGADGEGRSVAGVYPKYGLTYNEAQAAVAKLNSREDGYEYFLSNIWTAELLQDLMVVEFANSYTPAVMSGYPNYSSRGYRRTGETDNIPYCSGIQAPTDHANKSSCMKYRGIENIYGNGQELIDGVFISNGNITVNINGVEQSTPIKCPTTQGIVHQLGYDINTDLVFPTTIKSGGSYSENFYGNSDADRNVVYRGNYSDSGYGLFSFIPLDQTTKNNSATFRVVRRLKD